MMKKLMKYVESLSIYPISKDRNRQARGACEPLELHIETDADLDLWIHYDYHWIITVVGCWLRSFSLSTPMES